MSYTRLDLKGILTMNSVIRFVKRTTDMSSNPIALTN